MQMKRWGVILLVVALVMSVMGAAIAADDPGTEGVTLDGPESPYAFTLYDPEGETDEDGNLTEELVEFVFYWGLEEGDEDPCEGLEEDTMCLELKRPNHGQFVSTFVHWLLWDSELEGPPGKLVKQAAQDDFGKGGGDDDGDGEEAEVEDADDGPNHGRDNAPGRNR
jgi:hypothetical protein